MIIKKIIDKIKKNENVKMEGFFLGYNDLDDDDYNGKFVKKKMKKRKNRYKENNI